MLTGSQCTIYTRNPDGSYTRQTADCHWEDTRGVNFGKTGVRDVDSVFVMIPLELVDLPVLSENSQNYILRGTVDADVTAETLKDFVKTHDVLTITAIEKNDYSLGIADDHWAVYAK